MFLDRVTIRVRAGDGGDGAATFRREAHVPRGGPDGGDGGRGGSIYLEVDPGQTTLRDFQVKRHFKATPGGRGEGSRRHGKAGDDLVLDRPARHGRLRRRDRRAGRGPRRARPAGDGRPRRARRPREHALQDLHAPGAQARPEGRAGHGGGVPPRAPADRRHRAGRAPERRQVHDPRGRDRGPAQDRRLPVHHPRAEPRRDGPRRRGRAPAVDRRRPRAHRGRERRPRARARVPAPRRADADPRPRRRRVVARPRVGPRDHPRRAGGARPGAPGEADAHRVQQGGPAGGRGGLAGLPPQARGRRAGGRRPVRRRPARAWRRSAPGSPTCCPTRRT